MLIDGDRLAQYYNDLELLGRQPDRSDPDPRITLALAEATARLAAHEVRQAGLDMARIQAASERVTAAGVEFLGQKQ